MNANIARAYSLAPLDLVNHRTVRYGGDTLCCSMEEFVEEDRRIIQGLYSFIMALFARLSPPPARDLAGSIKEVLREYRFYQQVDGARTLGSATHRTNPSESLAKTIHDLRGGALTSLVGHLDAVVDLPDEENVPLALFPLVRDHIKIMRNSLSDLDYARRQFDLLPRAHSVDLMVNKWRNPEYGPTDRRVEVRVTCLQEKGTISECCVESAAIDRILYNLMNNAVRHSTGDAVDLIVLPIPHENSASLRFVVMNPIKEQDHEFLSSMSQGQDNLHALFQPGVSSTGSGLGLAIAAEFVANAYGLLHSQDAVSGGYVGACLVDDQFVTWFHWPLSAWVSNAEREVQIQKEETIADLSRITD